MSLAAEQQILEPRQVRVVSTPEATARLDQLLRDHHYLHAATLVGERSRYVATCRGRWLAVATWSGAAFHLKARDEFIGWSHEPGRRRRALLANNSRLAGGRIWGAPPAGSGTRLTSIRSTMRPSKSGCGN